MKKMKLLFTLIFAVLFAGQSYSAYLNISMYDDAEYTVTLGNHTFNSPVKSAEFKDLAAGSYYLKIAKKQSEAAENILFEGNIKIPDNFSLYSVIDENRNFVIYKKLQGESSGETDRCNCDCEYCRNCKNKHQDEDWGDYDNNNRPMKDRDFQDLVKLINDRAFESTKIDFAKTWIDKNSFSLDQVRTLLGLFAFESTKLDLAKYIYSSTCDRKHFYKLYDLFAFESSVKELNDFVTGKK